MDESTSQAASPRNSLAGQRIGSYQVIETLGSGGMSTVFRAVHAETGHQVALKVLLGSLSRSSNLLQRFLREARSAENLEHPNIVAIYDRGVDQGRHYLVLEYVEGGDFHEYVQRHGPLGAAAAIRVVRGVASGLRYAAGRGLIHRDIKPSNILRTPTGEAKIIDLGLALQAEFEDERVTREGTTVGTVDYMAPEQARDSRATSILSDIYSLGCTFYYLLAGIPPYPGGDITDKLTRHARSPAPDIRDLRPDIPAGVAAILLRMMAKPQEDRFADYDALIGALDAVRLADGDEAPGVALVPLEDDAPGDSPVATAEPRAARNGGASRRDRDALGDFPLDSPSDFSLALADERETGDSRRDRIEAEGPLPRLGRAALEEESDGLTDDLDADVALVPRGARTMPAWVLAVPAVCVAAVVLAIVLHRSLGGSGAAGVSDVEVPDPYADLNPRPVIARSGRPPDARPLASPGMPGHVPKPRPTSPPPSHATPKPRWVEPEDNDPIPGGDGPPRPGGDDLRLQLPEWTRAPNPDRSDDPVVTVRRFAGVSDGTTKPTLQLALNGYTGGTVELADDGPLLVDDLRMSGGSRVIRARRGYRPIIRILRSHTEAAREHSAFVLLERKSLTIEGIDLLVDARELSGRQKALFGCSGANLTLRDCTITVINPTNAPFTLVRQEPAARPSQIWLERTLVRGAHVTLAEMAGGAADVVLDGTAVLTAGAGPPVVRVTRPEAAGQRLFFVRALLACPGPVVQCDPVGESRGPAGRLAIHAFGSAFGRLQGPGTASLVVWSDPRAAAERQVEWAGDRNLYAAWRGYFAYGTEPTITVGSLSAVRSTWSATEQGSQETSPGFAWPHAGDPARWIPAELDGFLPGRRHLIDLPARPVPGLFPRTLDGYPEPLIPDAVAWALAPPIGRVGPRPVAGIGARPKKLMLFDPQQASMGGVPAPGVVPGAPVPGVRPPAVAAPPDLVMDTADTQWGGDLGAFLRTHARSRGRHLRVRVVGTGSHRFTPVVLPDGMTLEIQVIASGGPLPSWSPDPLATGRNLIELHDGALVLSNFVVRHDPDSKIESLLYLDGSHLILYRCQLTVPPEPADPAGDLIVFRAGTTRPMPAQAGDAVLRGPAVRPVCGLIDTILIANRTAIRAELGRGLIAMTRCAVAADETALVLDPGHVARSEFAADVWLERCTVVSGHSIVRLGPWPGRAAGPYRPCLLNSRHCAFLTLSDARSRQAALLRADADAFAGGCLFWQAEGDAFELDHVAIAGEAPAPATGPRDVYVRWERFWGSNRAGPTVIGPRESSFRFRERPRPGRIEPPDLILDPAYHPQRPQLDVGADLTSLGIAPRPVRPGARRN